MNRLPQDEKAQVKVITAGDEIALEQKLNTYLTQTADTEALVDLQISQIEYHSRTGTVDFALMAVLVMGVKK